MPTPRAKPSEEKQSIEALRERYQTLLKKQTTAEADLANANKRLRELQDEAVAQYGTDDLEKLEKLLVQMQDDNEKKRAQYQQDLDRIETNLAAVDQQFAAPAESSPEELF